MLKKFLLGITLIIALSIHAQIGYQVSLLNYATGEPRANERVTVTVKITDSKGTTVCEETKNETSNDFGVITDMFSSSKTIMNLSRFNMVLEIIKKKVLEHIS